MAEDPFDPILLTDSPDVRVAQGGLGLTLYLDDPLAWARGGAAAMLGSFLEVAPVERLGWFTTSTLEEWHAVSVEGLATLQQNLCNPLLDRPRHQFHFQLVDDTDAPEVGFSYREVDSARMARTGLLELTLPGDDDPNKLLQLALEVAHRWPFWCGLGGHVLRHNPHHRPTAYWWAFRFARRFVGLEIGEPEKMAWHVDRGLPGVSWLTLIGNRLAEERRIPLQALQARAWQSAVSVLPAERGTVLRAGEAPSLGDTNRGEYPDAYAEVAVALADHLMEEPPEHYGGFWKHQATSRWLRRFVEPAEWT